MDNNATLGKLAVAKATLSAELLRPHPSGTPLPVSSDVIKKLHSALQAALHKNSVEHVRTLKYILLEHIAPYTARVTALGKYLTALSPTLPTRRAKLYILYVLNDVLYHTTFISKSCGEFKSGIQQFLPTLFAIPWHLEMVRGKVDELVEIWTEKEYFHTFFLQSLRDPITLEQWRQQFGGPSQRAQPMEPKGAEREDDGRLPPVLGVHGAKYFELPVSNMLPCIQGAMPVPVTAPRPAKLRLTEDGRADEEVMSAVDKFYKCLEWKGGRFREADEKADEADEEEFAYEGWSVEFFRGRQDDQMDTDRHDSKSGSNYSDAGSPYRPRSRSLSRSRSRSRSLSPIYSDGSRSRSRSPRQHRSRSRTRSRSASYSPPEPSEYAPPDVSKGPTTSRSFDHGDRELPGRYRHPDMRYQEDDYNPPSPAPPPPPPVPQYYPHKYPGHHPRTPPTPPPPPGPYPHAELPPPNPYGLRSARPGYREPMYSEYPEPERHGAANTGPQQRPADSSRGPGSSRDRAAESYMQSVYGSIPPEDRPYSAWRR
ncbi:hypothetical protein V1517DRAFT_262836 [Lipomyces orientalis]|uniref:Uncharacterized protein n=1 Tax=Lipomyces orientalis TaxID=1233043 RepID=A0ACC3TJA5_9ASCO